MNYLEAEFVREKIKAEEKRIEEYRYQLTTLFSQAQEIKSLIMEAERIRSELKKQLGESV